MNAGPQVKVVVRAFTALGGLRLPADVPVEVVFSPDDDPAEVRRWVETVLLLKFGRSQGTPWPPRFSYYVGRWEPPARAPDHFTLEDMLDAKRVLMEQRGRPRELGDHVRLETPVETRAHVVRRAREQGIDPAHVPYAVVAEACAELGLLTVPPEDPDITTYDFSGPEDE